MRPLLPFASLMLILSLAALMLPTSGCKHLPEFTLPDTTDVTGIPCDPDSVYFEYQILPILVSNCAMDGCHSNKNPEEGINLTSYTKVMQTGEIRPGKLSGDLWEAINETKPSKIMPPPPRAPLTQAQKDLIRKWILQGAQYLVCDQNSGGCSTVNMSFSNDILPILQTSCTGCHGNTNPSAGINLSTYSGVAAMANSGRLVGAIRKQPGFAAMPPAGSALADCKIQKIEAWIAQGTQNN